MFAPSVPPDGVSTGRPLPSRGSARVRSPRSAVLSADSDGSTAIAPHFVTFAWRYLAFDPVRNRRPDPSNGILGRFLRGARTAVPGKERLSPPRFLGDPCVHALLSDPGGVSTSGRCNAETVAFRYLDCVGSAGINIGALSHSLHAPCVRFAAGIAPAPRHTRFRWMANPYRLGTFTRWAATRSFRFAYPFAIFLSFQALPGATNR